MAPTSRSRRTRAHAASRRPARRERPGPRPARCRGDLRKGGVRRRGTRSSGCWRSPPSPPSPPSASPLAAPPPAPRARPPGRAPRAPPARPPLWIPLRAQTAPAILAAVRASPLFHVHRADPGDHLRDVSRLGAPVLVTELPGPGGATPQDAYVVPITTPMAARSGSRSPGSPPTTRPSTWATCARTT